MAGKPCISFPADGPPESPPVVFQTIRWSRDDFTGNSLWRAIEKLLVNTLPALKQHTGNGLLLHKQRGDLRHRLFFNVQVSDGRRFKSVMRRYL